MPPQIIIINTRINTEKADKCFCTETNLRPVFTNFEVVYEFASTPNTLFKFSFSIVFLFLTTI